MDAFDAIGLLLPALEKVGDKVVGYDDRIRKKFNRALQTALKANDELYIQKVEIHMPELVGLIVLVMDEPSSINTIPLPNYINRDEFRNFYDETKRDEDLSHVLHEERKLYKIKEANDTLKAIDERIKELSNSVDNITNKIESKEGINKGFTHQSTTVDYGNSSPFATEYFARDLCNGDIERFLNRMKSFFANYPYELIRDLEYHYQNVMYLFCNLLGLSTEAEYHTSRGRIDMVVKTQQFIYVFEFKFNKSAKEALEQIDRKEYLAPFRMDGRKLYKVGINFSNKNNNIAEWLWEVEQSSCEAVNYVNGNDNKDSVADSVSPLVDCLKNKLEEKRKHHPSFRLMDIDKKLFPNGMVTFDTEALDSNNEPKKIKEIVAESWKRGETNHLMIEGEGGIGKTVTLLSMPDNFAPHPVPAIYIPLHELKEETNTIEKYIKNRVLDSKDKEQYDLLQDIVNKPWEEGPHLLFLLDGFNEIAVEHRESISEDIEQWSELLGLQIITSSRFDIHQYVALRSSFSKIELQPLSEETVSEYLVNHKIGVPDNPAVIKLITIPLLLTLYIKAETIRNDRPSPFAKFKDTKNAGLLIWNYLQCELWRYRNKKEESKECVLAMEFIAPFIAWTMQQHTEFVLDESSFFDRIDEAYNLLKRHIDAHAQLPEHIKTSLRQSPGLPSSEHIGDLLKEHLCLFINNEGEYRLMHQQFRDALAAMHLINLSYLSGVRLPNEWKTSVDYYVMLYVVDLINEKEANHLWEQNRNTQPVNENATRNLLRLQSLLNNNDLSHLDFSTLDLSDISLYPYRITNTTIKLPIEPEKMNQTKLAGKTFSAEGHMGYVTAIAITPNGKQIISVSDDCTVRIWDIESGENIKTFKQSGQIFSMAVMPIEKQIVIGPDDYNIYVLDMETSKCLKMMILGHIGPVTAVTVTPNGKQVVSGSMDNTVRIWDIETGENIRTLEGHKSTVKTIVVMSNGKQIVSGAGDYYIRIWDIKTGENIRTLKGHKGWVNAIAVTPNGKQIVSGSNDNTVRIWDIKTGVNIRTLKGHKDRVNAIAVTPNGKQIVSGSNDNTICIWDIETGSLMGKPVEGHDDGVTAVAVTPNGKRIVSGSQDSTIRVWDMETRAPIGNPMERQRWLIISVIATLDGKHIVSKSVDNTLRVWNIETGVLMGKPIEKYEDFTRAFAVTPDEKRIVGGSDDHTIRIWDIQTGAPIGKPIEGHEDSVTAVAVTPDGKRIVSGSDDHTIRIWDIETGAPIGEPIEEHEGVVSAVTVTPDGKRIISRFDNGNIRVWNMETGIPIGKTIQGIKGWEKSVAATPDGKRIISESNGGIIYIWDIETGTQIGEIIDSFESLVYVCAVTSDGKRIVSWSNDRTIRVWDIETGEPIGEPFKEPEYRIGTLAVTSNGKHIVSCASNGTLWITDIETREVKKIKIHPLSFVGLDLSLADISDPELKETLRQNGAKV